MREHLKVFEKDVPGLGNVKFFIDESIPGAWFEVKTSNGDYGDFGWAYVRACDGKLKFGYVDAVPPSCF